LLKVSSHEPHSLANKKSLILTLRELGDLPPTIGSFHEAAVADAEGLYRF
jgi:hypothetical protein